MNINIIDDNEEDDMGLPGSGMPLNPFQTDMKINRAKQSQRYGQDSEEEGEIRPCENYPQQQLPDDDLAGFSKCFQLRISLSFVFKLDFILDNGRVDESFLDKFEALNVLKGDFEPIDLYMAKIAYNNIDNKLNGLKDAQKVRNLLKI